MEPLPNKAGTRRRRPWQETSASPTSSAHHQGSPSLSPSSPATTAAAERRFMATFDGGNESHTGNNATAILHRLSLPEFSNRNNAKMADHVYPTKLRVLFHPILLVTNRWQNHEQRALLTRLVLSILIMAFTAIIILNSSNTFGSLDRISDELVGIPILIPYLDATSTTTFQNTENEIMMDLGGWLTGPESNRRLMLPQEIDDVEEARDGRKLVDHGGLVILPLSQQNFQRIIRPHDNLLYHQEKESQIKGMNQDYISKRHWFDDELEDYNTECRRVSWEHLHFPNCALFHEVDISRIYDKGLAQRSGDHQAGEAFYLSHGYFRDVFSLDQHLDNSKAVMKVARYKRHDINYRSMYNARRDALIMERLTGSPNIVDIYGHCGSSVMVESLPHEVEEFIVPGDGYMKQKDLSDSEDVDVQNHYNVSEKISLALEMAESIAELHGFADGVIVHDDIQLCQWLRNDKGKLKLGDFNRARVLNWNEKEQEYCKYENGRGYGNYRSPEEYGEKELSMQHDVWSMGNNIYGLLTGLWVFYENEDDEVVAGKVVNGTLAFIDDRYRKRSYAERRMVEIIERCWVYDMDKRADIFEVVNFLRKTKTEQDRRSYKNA